MKFDYSDHFLVNSERDHISKMPKLLYLKKFTGSCYSEK